MTRSSMSPVDEFRAVLRRCTPVGETGKGSPRVRMASTDGRRTLVGWNAGVGLTCRLEPGNSTDADVSALSDPGPVPEFLTVPCGQTVGQTFVRAMRDTAGVVRRTADVRYAYHRVLVDARLGRVAATDGIALFAHGGLDIHGPVVAVPAIAAWAAPIWRTDAAATVGITPDFVVVTAGAWAIALPVDRAARSPDYDAVLARLRRPVARLDLSSADAAAWAERLTRTRLARRTVVAATIAWTNPPSLAVADTSPAVAGMSTAAGPPVRVTCAADRVRQALALGFRTLTTVGPGHPLVALDGPRRFVWVAHSSA